MNERKETVKKEVINNAKVIFSLCITLILINYDISIANQFKSIEDEKIKWALDFGIYNAILGILFTYLLFKVNKNKLYINIEILSKSDGSNVIKLNENPKKVYIKLKLTGAKPRKCNKIEIIFPHWVDFQIKPKNFIQTDENNNRCYIDIEYLINNRNEVYLTEEISIDLISNTVEGNEDIIQSNINRSFFDKVRRINFTKKDIKIKKG